ncbi:hypothetical protein [Rhodococcus opacus]|uniref:Hypothetical membrane protein n=1 Tax=Rhodococcus opacus (strain B4) TaxID=632772 RepID=C1B6G9_RHOOB|nr:hypothetical protein [Rhodococcus opacus]BAH51272.1 hypothetical membrane protein [Rhodococcus opacus B4]
MSSLTAEDLLVAVEPDPTPLVLSVARTLRASAEVPELRALIGGTTGTVALKSVVDPQAATLDFADGRVHVRHGVDGSVEPLELHFYPEYTVVGGGEIGHAVGRLLSPPLPDWNVAAQKFWELNADSAGFPEQLVIVCIDNDERLVFGDGVATFEIHGSAESLSAVLSGMFDSFLIALGVGAVAVIGSAAQISVMCGAHWKVRFNG